MASDEIVWSVIAHQFCSFKLKTTKDATFCRNEYNVTGLCNRQSCPLANSRYATVRSDNGVLYLYMKTIERAHMPNRQWERIKLSENYTKALAQLDERLIYWPSWLIHKCKQRLTRLTQVAIRTRRMALLDAKMGEKLVGIKPKIKRREETRERKALAAAKLERSIEKELIERLKSGAYGEQPLNVEEGIWKKVLKGLEREGQAERDVDYESEEEEEEEDEEEAEVEYVSGDEDLEDEELADLEDWLGEGEESGASSFEEDSNDEDVSDSDESDSGDEADEDDDEKSKKKPSGPKRPLDTGKKRKSDAPAPKAKKRRGPRVEIEYEDNVPLQRELAV